MRKILFLLLFVVELAIPSALIVRNEMILSRGEIVKFEINPYDPYDPFRGHYMRIQILEGHTVRMKTGGLKRGQRVYATIQLDENGFGHVSYVYAKRPADGLYIASEVSRIHNRTEVRIKFPFDRYYISEKYAPISRELFERISFSVGQERREEEATSYVTVRVREGRAVMEDLYLLGVEAQEFFRQKYEEQE